MFTHTNGTSPRMADNNLYRPQIGLVKEAFILGTTSWAIMTKTNFFIY